MISSCGKMASIQIIPEVVYECHNNKKLFPSGAVITLKSIQSPTDMGYHFLLYILDLSLLLAPYQKQTHLHVLVDKLVRVQ